MPELDDLSRDDLIALLDVYAKNWLAHDGSWFLAAEEKCGLETAIGIIKEVIGFRQFSLRGLLAAAGKWSLVCLAYNLKRLHTLQYS